MRIVVSGTHASGKSTLISDFHAAHPDYLVLPDPFEDLDLDDPAGERSFALQLHHTAARLRRSADRPAVISERGPLDFLAYLTALERLGRSDGSLLARASEIAVASSADVDLIVVLPLEDAHPISVPDEEDPELRRAMDESLAEILDDLVADGVLAPVVTITGDRSTRLGLLADAAGR